MGENLISKLKNQFIINKKTRATMSLNDRIFALKDYS